MNYGTVTEHTGQDFWQNIGQSWQGGGEAGEASEAGKAGEVGLELNFQQCFEQY